MDTNALQLILKQNKRENNKILYGRDPNKKYNIAFYGIGKVAEAGLMDIIDSCSNPSNTDFDYPIDNIYLIGRNQQGSVQRRQRLAEQANTILKRKNPYTDVYNCTPENLPSILPELDLFFFTADGNKNSQRDRTKMIYQNKIIVNELAPYFNKDFKGTINIISNLPEVLADHTSKTFDINKKQITAHIPLDLMRFENIISNILPDKDYQELDLVVVGYHNQVWPVINGSKIIKKYSIQNGKGILPEYQDITDTLNRSININDLAYILNRDAYNKFELQQRELNQESLPRTEPPTLQETGFAIKRFTQAFINHTNTTTAIPYQIQGKEFFVDLPVIFNDSPILDKERFSRLTEQDISQLNDRIVGEGPHSLEGIIQNTSNQIIKTNPTPKIKSKKLQKPKPIGMPSILPIIQEYNPISEIIKIIQQFSEPQSMQEVELFSNAVSILKGKYLQKPNLESNYFLEKSLEFSNLMMDNDLRMRTGKWGTIPYEGINGIISNKIEWIELANQQKQKEKDWANTVVLALNPYFTILEKERQLLDKEQQNLNNLDDLLSFYEITFLWGPPFTNINRQQGKSRYNLQETLTKNTHYHKKILGE